MRHPIAHAAALLAPLGRPELEGSSLTASEHALDSKTGRSIVRTLGDLATSEGTTVIIVARDPSIASATDVQLRMEDGALVQ